MKKLSIYVVIANYKTYEDLFNCLKAIELQIDRDKYNTQTIIIDSEFDSRKVDFLKNKYPSYRFILQKKSYGVSANYNRGFKISLSEGADYILMVTPDVYLQKNVLETLVNKIDLNKRLGAITAKTLLPTNPKRIYFVAGTIDPVAYSTGHVGYYEIDKGQYDNLNTTQYLNCAFALFRASVFKKIGYWEPKYYLTYEDADWTVRLKKAGYEIEVDKSVYAIHDESKTVGRKSMQQEYYMARNHLLFIERNASILNKLLAYLFVIKRSFELMPKLLRNDKQVYYILLGRRDYLLRRFGYKEIKD